MPTGLHRCYGAGYLHFITTSCYQRLPLLAKGENRDLFLEVFEQVRRRYRFVVVGYVVMPEHLHLLVSEPERGDLSLVMQVLKQGFARRLLCQLRRRNDPQQGTLWDIALEQQHIWQKRFYDLRFGLRRSGGRSCTIFTRTPCGEDWCWNRNNGSGAVPATGCAARLDRCW